MTDGLAAARERWLTAIRLHQPAVALADGNDERAQVAAVRLTELGCERVVVVSDAMLDLGTSVEAVQAVDPLQQAVEMLAAGEVGAVVAGATRTTSDVLRAAIRTVGLAEGSDTVTSCFLFELADGRLMAYGDCGVVPEPSVEQLASIAHDTATTFTQLSGEDASVAMLSFSTLGSAEHSSVVHVREATALARQRYRDLDIDGELQFDAAFDADVAAAKAPGSPVAGRANVFVFPNLAAGNIAYKITERIGGATALGPLLQGLAQPVHDLSRGCSADDIVDVGMIAAFQSIEHG